MRHILPVSYTHLDVYKRQVEGCAALANGVTLQGNGGLDDGVGVAVLEGLLQDGNGVLCSLCEMCIRDRACCPLSSPALTVTSVIPSHSV